jgi:hypothetical protein
VCRCSSYSGILERAVRIGIAIEIASSVDLLVRYANRSGSSVSGMMVFDVSYAFEAGHGSRCEWHGVIVN